MKIGSPEWLTQQMRLGEMGKAYGLSSGRMNPWDLPEYQSARENMLKDLDLGMSGYARNLTRSGVEGPAAALSMERMGNKYSGSILDMANKLRDSYTNRGLSIGNEIMNDKWKRNAMALQWEGMHDQRMAQPSALENIFKSVLGGASTLMSMFNSYKQAQSYANGGIIDEPVVGQGLVSGRPYTFGEQGPEAVSPMNGSNEFSDYLYELLKKKQIEDEYRRQQEEQNSQQQGQGGNSQMSPQSMLSIAQETPLNEYLGPLAKSETAISPGYGAAEAPEAGGASGGLGTLGTIGGIIAAAIAGQHALSRNTGTRISPDTGLKLEKGDPGYYHGTKTGDVFSGHFGTEPWLAFLHDKFNMNPTVGEQFDAADTKGKLKLAPALSDYWANPGGTWIADLGEKVLGKGMGKTARWVLNPLGELFKKLF